MYVFLAVTNSLAARDFECQNLGPGEYLLPKTGRHFIDLTAIRHGMFVTHF
jgi:hypothetical protein